MPRRAQFYSPEATLPQLPTRSWVIRSRFRARLFAVLAGVIVTLATVVLEWLFYVEGQPPMLIMAASDALAGILTALLLLRILNRMVERGDAVAARLYLIAEMNHHVRNALAMIQLSTASVQDERALAAIRQGCDRIEWALREILTTFSGQPAAAAPETTPGAAGNKPESGRDADPGA